MGTSSRVLITVVLSLGILILWQMFFATKPPLRPPSETTTSNSSTRGPTSLPSKESISEKGSRASESSHGKRSSSSEGKLTTIYTSEGVATFSNRGAALRHWILNDSRYKEVWQGKLQQVDLIHLPPGKSPWPLSTTFPNSEIDLPADAEYTIESQSQHTIRYQWRSNKVQVIKQYTLYPKRSTMEMSLDVENITSEKLRGRLEISLFNYQEPGQNKGMSFTNPYPQINTVLCYVNGKLYRRSLDAINGKGSDCSSIGCGMGEGPVNQTGEVLWISSDNRYFMISLVPKDQIESRRCELTIFEDNIIKSALLYPEVIIEPGKKLNHNFTIFLGPKDLGKMDKVKSSTEGEVHLGEAIEFGWLAILCRPMLWLMKIFHSWFGNWGVAIILLTIVVKLLTLYWTQKSMRSMKEMQRLKPKIDQLREKYQNDKQRLNQEMMNLYKVHKVNPLGGCLPMIIQMPIWFALYRTLGNAVELYRSSFILWIKDLTSPDPYYVLPIAMGISMYAQQAITPQPVEASQAKMMKYFMPGMFTVMMLWLPSGLTLYIFVNTILTMVHQWYMNRNDPYRENKAMDKKLEDKKTEKQFNSSDSKKKKRNR